MPAFLGELSLSFSRKRENLACPISDEEWGELRDLVKELDLAFCTSGG